MLKRGRHPYRICWVIALVAVAGLTPTPGGPPAKAAPHGRNGLIALALASGEPSVDGQDIFTVRPSGRGLQRLTSGPYNDSYPAWSPDGRRIAFTREVPGPAAGWWSGLQDIFVVDADGGEPVNLTQTIDIAEVRPDWSPDGRRIVFQRAAGGNRRPKGYDLYVMDADGGNLRQIAQGGGPSYPKWSPDGHWIAFSSREADAIQLVRPDGSDRHQLVASDPDGRGSSYAWGQNWSPDGKQLVFAYGRSEYERDILVVNREGTHARWLTAQFLPSALFPAWSPDGERIVFLKFHGDRYVVFTMKADGSDKRRLISLTLDEFSPPDWGPRP